MKGIGQINIFSLLVGGLLFLGYLFMLISIISEPSSSPDANMVATIDNLRRENSRKIVDLQAELSNLKGKTTKNTESKTPSNFGTRSGVIILGMHRSGTSIIGGLMTKMGLQTGGPLISAAEDNEKGFFERIDVVLQNDYLMKDQQVHYGWKTHKYDVTKGLKRILTDDGSFFKEDTRALAFLNNPASSPWMLKDPRLCITLRTWLPLLTTPPAILFTYRHPLDVALSLHKRAQEQYSIAYALRIWYVYNRRAIQQSNDLCRVVSSHHNAMTTPDTEFARIHRELHLCGVNVPRLLTQEDISSFIDMRLQHGKTTLKEDSCRLNIDTLQPPATWVTQDPSDLKLYREAMRVYCAMEDKSAFTPSFVFDESIVNL